MRKKDVLDVKKTKTRGNKTYTPCGFSAFIKRFGIQIRPRKILAQWFVNCCKNLTRAGSWFLFGNFGFQIPAQRIAKRCSQLK